MREYGNIEQMTKEKKRQAMCLDRRPIAIPKTFWCSQWSRATIFKPLWAQLVTSLLLRGC